MRFSTTVLVLLAACTVDPGPSPTQCDPEGRCDTGYVCDPRTNTCVEGHQSVAVALAGAGSGTVTSVPGGIDCGRTCSAEFEFGTMVALEATPDATSTFVGWEGDCTGMGACSVVADHDVSVTATFARQMFELTVTTSGVGSGTVTSMPSGIDCGATCAASFEVGTSVMLVASADPGSSFDGFSGDCTGAEPCTVTMDAARTVGAAFSAGGALWARTFGSASFDSGLDVAVDATDDVVVAGYFQGDADFGSGTPLRGAGSEDVFVAKYGGADGAHLWSVRFGGVEADRAHAVAVDEAGDVLVCGFFQDTVDFGEGPVTSMGGFDVFLLKLSGEDGSTMWALTAGGSTGTDGAFGIALDEAGDVYIVGNYQGSVDFGGGPLPGMGLFDGFAAKYSGTDGSHVWSTTIGGPGGTEFVESAEVRSTGDLLVVGSFGGMIVLGGTTLTSSGNTDVFAAELGGADGAYGSAWSWGGSGFDYGTGLALDASDDGFVVSAAFDATIVFGGAPLSSTGFFDLAIAKFTSAAAHSWSTSLGGAGSDYIYGVAPAAGGFAISGVFRDSLEAGRTLRSAGDEDALVASFDGDGRLRWARGFGGSGPDPALAIAADASGDVFVTGSFEQSFVLDGQTLTSNGLGDAFLVKLGN